ncbi:kinase-like domain-containing protein [Flammula alnicola]|nr:kinase-like domain-containing protein [Flammula alnicola]
MDSSEHAQKQEMTALQSIYGDDFIESPPPKAWKGAARLHEFIIRVSYPEPEHAQKISFDLHVKFPKTYPHLACPMFSIEKPIKGINDAQCTTLLRAINVEAQRFKGGEMVFEIVSFSQEWLRQNVIPPVEVVGSLALQMNQRAIEEARERRRLEREEAEREEEKALREAQALESEIQADAMRQLAAKEQVQASRRRANSEATEVPNMSGYFDDVDILTETFHDMHTDTGVKFDTVRLFHPRTAHLGIVYMADPIVDEKVVVPPLELYSVTFESHYYTTTQGRKKLNQIEQEIKHLIAVRHPKLLTVYAAKLNLPHSSGPPQLMVLTEQTPALTLHDVLEDCESFREDRASDYIGQILTALNAIHHSGLVHKGITTRCIGLACSDNPSQPKTIKLCKTSFYTKLLDLHRSNSFGPGTPAISLADDPRIPEGWVSSDVQNESSLLYTRQRDIHDVGIVLMQMLMGLNVLERFPDPASAIKTSAISPLMARQVLLMLEPPKKGTISCDSLLSDLNEPKTPMPFQSSSPEGPDYFRLAPRTKPSRWKEDWEELELLGKGAFGSVVKARNKVDSRIYAVKKIRVKTVQSDKIFREVNALSRLSHRNIVRYYTTWFELNESATSGADSGTDSGTEGGDGMTSVPDNTSERHLPINGGFQFNIEDFDDLSVSRSSFPSIHFSRSSSPGDTSGESDSTSSGEDGDEYSGLFKNPSKSKSQERVDEGISEDEAWRLFQQIVDALAHMSTLNILHRDIKLTNIFIDAKGDCKVGDFGLATSSLAAVDPSDVASPAAIMEADMTLGRNSLYIAPEVQSRRRGRGPRDHSKADMYSLGIVFFEMNFKFNTGAERIAVLEDLRKPSIIFPTGWDVHRVRQREIITWLLQHEPDKRPSALELSQSPLLPTRLEDEYYKSALRLMGDSPYHQTVLATLFKQPPRPSRAFIYDSEIDSPEYASLNNTVEERLAAIFRLHDSSGVHRSSWRYCGASKNILVPFARLAARESIRRIKRYHITNVFRPNPVAGHPKFTKAALFDIITSAEIIAVANDCLDSFPNLSQSYDIHISHSKLVEIAMNRVPADIRSAVVDILLHPSKSSASQKRTLLLKKGLLRSTADELEILSEAEEDVDNIVARLEKTSPTLVAILQATIQEVKDTIQFAHAAGVSRQIFFRPLMLGSHHTHFKGGVIVEVVRRNKHTDVLAAGGRYDNLISRFHPMKQKPEPICAQGIQIAVEKITAALAAYQSASIKTLVKEERSFGFWSPRRCDVYVVSYHPGYLQDRLEVVSYLWQNNISADLMYEFGLPDTEHENHLDICAREGILFTVYPRPRTGRNLPAFKVKSILKGTEVDLSKQELVSWLQHQIADQKRVDATTSGAPVLTETSAHLPVIKDTAVNPQVQLVLPDPKKQRKNVKQLFEDKAFEKALAVKNCFQNGMPVLAVDVTSAHFDAMTKSSAWITDEEAWKPIAAMFPAQHAGYAQQVRDAALKRKSEGNAYILMFAVREDRAQLLAMS